MSTLARTLTLVATALMLLAAPPAARAQVSVVLEATCPESDAALQAAMRLASEQLSPEERSALVAFATAETSRCQRFLALRSLNGALSADVAAACITVAASPDSDARSRAEALRLLARPRLAALVTDVGELETAARSGRLEPALALALADLLSAAAIDEEQRSSAWCRVARFAESEAFAIALGSRYRWPVGTCDGLDTRLRAIAVSEEVDAMSRFRALLAATHVAPMETDAILAEGVRAARDARFAEILLGYLEADPRWRRGPAVTIALASMAERSDDAGLRARSLLARDAAHGPSPSGAHRGSQPPAASLNRRPSGL